MLEFQGGLPYCRRARRWQEDASGGQGLRPLAALSASHSSAVVWRLTGGLGDVPSVFCEAG